MFYSILFLVIIYFSIVLYYRISHPFWYQQPVDFPFTFRTKEGKIGKMNYIHNYNKNYSISRWTDEKSIVSFLNKSFQPGGDIFEYTDDTCKNCTFFRIKKENEVCGCISVKPLNSFINEKQETLWYVDHLTVSKNHRGMGLATDLISTVLDTIGDKTYLFKKDIQPLPFNYFCKYNYYLVLDKPTENLPNVSKAIDIKKKFKVHIENKDNVIFLEKDKKYAIVYYTNIKYNGNPVYEIGYAENKEIAELAVNYIKKQNSNSRIYVNNLSGTSKFFEKKFLSYNYIYFYNYRMKLLTPNEIFLSFS